MLLHNGCISFCSSRDLQPRLQVCSNKQKYVIICNNMQSIPSAQSCHHVQVLCGNCCGGHDAQNPVNTHYYTLSQSLSLLYLKELWITKWGLKLIYKIYWGKVVMYVLPITSVPWGCLGSGWRYWDHPVLLLQRLSQLQTLLQPWPCQHWLKHRSRDCCQLYFVNSWALGWSNLVPPPLKCNEEQCVIFVIAHYYTLYYNITLAIITNIFVNYY